MADDTKNGTIRSNLGLVAPRVNIGGNFVDSTVSVAAAASAASVYTMYRLPTNARIHGWSRVAFDDLASTGSPTIDFGFKAVDENFTTNDAALNDGVDVATAAGTANLIKDHANYGKTVWEILGESSDPGGFADLTITIKDAATNTGGDVTLSLMYSVD
jgi:hypothetical protein